MWGALKDLAQGITCKQDETACKINGIDYTYGTPNTTLKVTNQEGKTNTYTYDDNGEVSEIRDNDNNLTYSAKRMDDGSVQITTAEYKNGIPKTQKTYDKATGKTLAEANCYKTINNNFITDTNCYNADGIIIGVLHSVLAEDGSWKNTSYRVNKDGSYSLNSVKYYEKDAVNPSKAENYTNGKLQSIEYFNKDGSLSAKDDNPVSNTPDFLMITGGDIKYDKYNGCASVVDELGRTALRENEDGTITKYDYTKKPDTSYTFTKTGTLLNSVEYYKDGCVTTTYDLNGEKDLIIKTDKYNRPSKVTLAGLSSEYNPPETIVPNFVFSIYDFKGSILRTCKYNGSGKLIKDN